MENYKRLTTYVLATIVHDLTILFCRKFIRITSRTVDQMEQAARSGKQNIAEGYSQQSLESYIKLLGVSFGSSKELSIDYEDFLRQKGFFIWSKYDSRIRAFRDFRTVWRSPNIPNTFTRRSLGEVGPNLPNNPEIAANLLITFCQMETYLLNKQIIALKSKFISQGGFRENLFKKRLKFINKSRP